MDFGVVSGHAHGHRDPGDGQPQQGHVPHHDQGVQHSLTFQLAKNIVKTPTQPQFNLT